MRVFDQKEICRNILSVARMFCKSVFSVYVFDDFPCAVCSIRYTLSYVWMHTVLEKPPTGSSISCVTTILKLINSVHSKRQTWIGLRNRLRYDVLRCAVGNIMSIFFYVWMPIVLQKPLTGSSVSCVTVVMKLIYSVHFKRHTWIGLSQLISILIQ